jgi:hypothetical protein
VKWSLPQFAVVLTVALTLFFWPSIFDGKVLMPLDILTHMSPFEAPAGEIVHNRLIGDMLWENLAWKTLQRESILRGEMPLWNPYSFCGHPLYATGQASTFYPFNLILVLVPLPYGYVAFTWLHLLLGGIFAHLYMRRVGVGGFGASVGGVMFAMCAYFVVRFIWPMLLGSAIWLPLMLLWIDWMSDRQSYRSVLKGLLSGAVLFAMPLLSGFFEIAFYVFFACGLYTLTMGLRVIWREKSLRDGAAFFAKVGVATLLAVMVAGPQMLPFFEGADFNVRAGEMTYQSARGKAITWPETVTFAVPDILGNPSVHEQFDLASRECKAIKTKSGGDNYYYGPQNYVESTNYIGLLPLGFALLGLTSGGRRRSTFWVATGLVLMAVAGTRLYEREFVVRLLPTLLPLTQQVAGDVRLGLVLLGLVALALGSGGQRRWYFALLLGVSLALAFVTPLYSLLFKVVPGMDQVRSPWRWTVVTMFACSYLAAVGADHWFKQLSAPAMKPMRLAFTIKTAAMAVVAIVVLWLLYSPARLTGFADGLLKPVEGGLAVLKAATGVFESPASFANLLWLNAARFAIFGLASVLIVSLAYWRQWGTAGAGLISFLAVGLIAFDLGQATYHFNTHSDPEILKQRPPIVQKLQEAAATETFRIGRFGWKRTFSPNSPTLCGLQDFGGYDSVILRDFARYMQAIEPQQLLYYNQIVQFRSIEALTSPLARLLNVRYVLSVDPLVHEDYEKVDVPGNVGLYRLKDSKMLGRAFFVGRVERTANLNEATGSIKSGQVDVAHTALVETIPGGTTGLVDSFPGEPGKAKIVDYRPSRVRLETSTPARQFLVLCDVYYPGWRAYVDGAPANIMVTDGIFRGVSVPAGDHTVEFRFEPCRLRIGLLMSLVCLVGLVAAGIVGRFVRGPAAQPELGVPQA